LQVQVGLKKLANRVARGFAEDDLFSRDRVFKDVT
jgi:hypothetical protein